MKKQLHQFLFSLCRLGNNTMKGNSSIIFKIFLLTCLIPTLGYSQLSGTDNYLNFDGVDDEIQLDKAVFSSTDETQAYTIEAWVKAGTQTDNCIVGQYINTSDNRFQFEIRDQKLNWWKGKLSGNDIDIRSSTNITDNNWHHVAGTRSASGAVKLYIDGELAGEGVDNSVFDDYKTSIGARVSTNSGHFKGSLDEVRIWETERTAEEIKARMKSKLSGEEAGLIVYYSFNQGIAGKDNTTETTLIDATTNYCNGVLANFTLLDATSNWVSVEGTVVALDELRLTDQINAYPNPAQDDLFISTSLSIQKIELHNITGTLLQTLYNTSVINLSDFTDGLYLLKITTNQGIAIKQITKK